MDYRRKFIELLGPLERIPKEIAKGQFLNELKGEIKVEVRLLGPRNLDHTMDLALMVEDKLRVGSNKRAEYRVGSTSITHVSYMPSQSVHPSKGSSYSYSSGSLSPRASASSVSSVKS